MKLNHLNLTVSDVPAARQFLEKYFGLQGTVDPHSGRSLEGDNDNRNFMVLFDDAGLVLTLMKSHKGAAVEYPSTFHIGFIQPSEEHVNELNRRMKPMASTCRRRSEATPGPSTCALRAVLWWKC